MAEYNYPSIESIAVNIVEDSITLNMHTTGAGEQKNFNFDTTMKEDIANLIASYSPAHQNWQRVGEAKIKTVRWNCLSYTPLSILPYLPCSSYSSHHTDACQ